MLLFNHNLKCILNLIKFPLTFKSLILFFIHKIPTSSLSLLLFTTKKAKHHFNSISLFLFTCFSRCYPWKLIFPIFKFIQLYHQYLCINCGFSLTAFSFLSKKDYRFVKHTWIQNYLFTFKFYFWVLFPQPLIDC